MINVSYGYNTVTLFNQSCAPVSYQASAQASWVTAVSPTSGTIAPGGSATIGVTANTSSLGEGQFEDTLAISWPGAGPLAITIRVSHPGNPPVISPNIAARCSTTSGPYVFQATVTDDFGVAAVSVQVTRPDGTTGSITMTLSGGKYVASGTEAIVSWSIVAADFNVPSAHVASTNPAPCSVT